MNRGVGDSSHFRCAGDGRACHNPKVKRVIAPAALAPTAAKYAHAVLAIDPKRLLHTSGVVPIDADGNVPASLAEQAEVVWRNLAAILDEAGMKFDDVLSVTTYVVHGNDLGAVMAARDDALQGHLAASTLVTVPALAKPEWKMEISLVAAS